MKVLTNYKDLEGKTISFAHMDQFAEQITLATTDGEVLMATLDGYDIDQFEIVVKKRNGVIFVIDRDEYLREKLNELGIFNLEEWKKERAEEERIDKENRLKEQEKREWAEYERLKAKFEGN